MGSEKRKRRPQVNVRFTEDEEIEVRAAANKVGAASLAAYIRHCALNNGEVVSKVDIDAAMSLVRLGADVSKIGGLLALHVKVREHRDSPSRLRVVETEIENIRKLRLEILETLVKLKK